MRLRYELQMVKREREREEKTNDERMKFFSNITHELRTPLTLIVDPINNLASATDIGVTSKRKLALIRMSALRLSYLIQQIREFTKTEVRTRRLTVSHGNLTEAVRSSAVRFQSSLRARVSRSVSKPRSQTSSPISTPTPSRQSSTISSAMP